MADEAFEKKENLFLLIRKAKAHDRAAFQELYQAHVTPIFRFIYFRVKNQADAEDLTQTVFLRSWKVMSRFSEDGPDASENPFSSFLYAVAQNAIIDYWKKKKDVSLEDHAESLNEIKDERLDAGKRVALRERSELIRETLQELSEDQREIITLKFLNDLSNKEISKITGKTEEAIRALQYRAIKVLRGLIKE